MSEELNVLTHTQIIYVNSISEDGIVVFSPEQALYMEGAAEQVSVVLAGPQGPAGPSGVDGVDGTDGVDGSTWYSGSGAPGGGTGVNGDFYFRTDNDDVYKKTGGSWSVVANIKGSTGATGSPGANGTNGADGVDGVDGVDGSVWHSGSGAPGGGTGVNGDYYYNTANGDIYTKSGGAWGSAIANITGPTGSTGAAGTPGGGLFASYVSLDGTGDYVSTPDTVANSIAGDLDVRVRVSLDDWTPGATGRLACKVGAQASWYFQAHTSGVLEFGYSTDGSAIVNQASSAHNFINGKAYWVRATIDVDNGSSQHVVTFYTAPDSSLPPTVWTQLSTHTVAAVASIYNSTNAVTFGATSQGNNPCAGKIYRGMLYSGINGTLINDFNPSKGVVYGSTMTAVTGEVWTLNGDAAWGGGNDGPRGLVLPTDDDILRVSTLPTNAVAESFDRRIFTAANISELSSGRLSLYAIALPAGKTIKAITFRSGTTALATGTNQWFGLFDSTRAQLALTDDDTSTAWAANTLKTKSFAAPFVTTYSGLYYVGILVAATTVPSLYGFAGNSTIAGLAPVLKGTSSTGLTNPASCPNPAGAITAGANLPYFYLS